MAIKLNESSHKIEVTQKIKYNYRKRCNYWFEAQILLIFQAVNPLVLRKLVSNFVYAILLAIISFLSDRFCLGRNYF